MAFTPYSWITYPGNGTTNSFVVPFPYAKREHVRAFIDWDPSTRSFTTELAHGTDFTWADGTSITATVAPAAGTTISLVRETPIDEQLTEWQAGSPPTAFDLNTADLQVLYALQEYIDRTLQTREDFDAAVFSGSGVTLIDNLNSTLATAALTANQGRTLRLLIEAVETLADAAQGAASDAATAAAGAAAAAEAAQDTADAAGTAAAAAAGAAVPIAGGTMTGPLAIPSLNGGQLAGLRNRIINGGFDIWNRTLSRTGFGFAADRWLSALLGGSQTTSLQEFPAGNAIENLRIFSRTTFAGTSDSLDYNVLIQRIEDVRITSGQTLTLSFWARGNVARPMSVEFTQSFGTGGSPSPIVNGIGVTKFNITTTWQKCICQIDVPSVAGKTFGTTTPSFLELVFWFSGGPGMNSRNNTLGVQSGIIDLAAVQLEVGTTATPFEKLDFATTINQCNRYCQLTGGQWRDDTLPGTTAATQVVTYTLSAPMAYPPTCTITAEDSLSISGPVTALAYGTWAVMVSFMAVNNIATPRYHVCTILCEAEI